MLSRAELIHSLTLGNGRGGKQLASHLGRHAAISTILPSSQIAWLIQFIVIFRRLVEETVIREHEVGSSDGAQEGCISNVRNLG
jgi:hypothetical protein